MQKLYFLFFWYFFYCSNIFGQNNIIFLNEIGQTFIPNNSISYLEDKHNSFTIEQVDSLFKHFPTKTLKKSNANFYQTNSAYWFKFQVKVKDNNANLDWLLKIDYALLDDITLFYQNNHKHWLKKQAGDTYPYTQREIKDKSFLLKLPIYKKYPYDNTPHTFYVKIKTNSVFQAPFSFEKSNEYYQKILSEEIFLAILYGALFILIFYNLFLFFVLWDNLYFLYVFFILSCTFLLSGIIGHNAQYLFYNNPFLAEITIIPTSCIFFYALTLFTQYFLALKQNLKKAYFLLEIFKYIALSDMLFYLISNQSILANKILHLFIFFGVLCIMIISFYAWYKKIPHASYFALSFVFLILAIIIYVLKLLNVLPHIYLTTHITRIALVLQGLFFSFALANKYKKIKNELIESQKNQNEKLELKVKQRTQEIETLNQELLTQNEELHQSQEEILAQREFIQLKNQTLESQNQKINSSINSALLIQEAILPHKAKKDNLLKQYFDIFLPKDVVSGDFYWINQVDDSLFISVIDCTGHGVPGAFMTMIANSLLDKIIKIWHITEPSKILETLHQEIKIMLQQDETNNQNGMDIAILKIKREVNNTFKIIFSGAKNGFLFINSANNEINYVAGTRKGIGGFQNKVTCFEEKTIILQTNDTIYMTTDGFLDQNDKFRKKIGLQRFIEMLKHCRTLENMEKQKSFLLSELQTQMEGTSQRDDICVIGLKLV